MLRTPTLSGLCSGESRRQRRSALEEPGEEDRQLDRESRGVWSRGWPVLWALVHPPHGLCCLCCSWLLDPKPASCPAQCYRQIGSQRQPEKRSIFRVSPEAHRADLQHASISSAHNWLDLSKITATTLPRLNAIKMPSISGHHQPPGLHWSSQF